MLNKLKAIVAKPPTSNRKFHRDTEDVLKSLGRRQQQKVGDFEADEFAFQRHFVSEEGGEEDEEEEEEDRRGEKRTTKTKAKRRSRRKIVLQNGDVYEGR